MPDVEYAKDGNVARVTLNRPKALNAINTEMDEALLEIWSDVNSDSDVWVVVLTGAGERAFCAGADISGDSSAARRIALGGGLTGVGGPLVTLSKPLIAAVRGYVVGGGFELAMCADIIVAADDAQFMLPETSVGIIGESGILHRAMRQLPYHVALSMILTGERLDAERALAFGLVNEVVPPDELLDAANRWAEKITSASPLAVQAAKQAALGALGRPLDLALATRYEPIEAYASSEDVQEGARARQEKRKPVWQGR
jgi:enoyl-CoA hydratase/carnithine racemase